MNVVVFQVLLLGTYFLFLIVARDWARERAQRQAEAERAWRAALEREWRVGIPYDPDPPDRAREAP